MEGSRSICLPAKVALPLKCDAFSKVIQLFLNVGQSWENSASLYACSVSQRQCGCRMSKLF